MTLNYEAAATNVAMLWMLTVPHEFAHAWVAVRLGDETPRREGRVTLNPLAHVDWLGTVILPAILSLTGRGFLGWGKAVNTNVGQLRGGLNGLALVALAGPLSNVVFAFLLVVACIGLARGAPLIAGFAARAAELSLFLAIFNLLPVPPLDGSKLLLAARLPVFLYNELARAGFLVLVVLMMATGLGHWMWLASQEGVRFMLGLLGQLQ